MTRPCLLAALALLPACVARELRPHELETATAYDLQETFRDAMSVGCDPPQPGSYAWRVREVMLERFAFTWSDEERGLVGNCEVTTGMTPQMVFWAMGPPGRIDRSTSPFGNMETWHWCTFSSFRGHSVSFRDGHVVWWNASSTN
jgi:hypothetical protein